MFKKLIDLIWLIGYIIHIIDVCIIVYITYLIINITGITSCITDIYLSENLLFIFMLLIYVLVLIIPLIVKIKITKNNIKNNRGLYYILSYLISYCMVVCLILYLFRVDSILSENFKKFDKNLWIEYPKQRRIMYNDLVTNYELLGMSISDIKKLLGNPNHIYDNNERLFYEYDSVYGEFIVEFADKKCISYNYVD